jgi:stress response protein YsnF
VVEMRLVLVEELRVTKRRVTTQHTEPVHLRREELSVEHLPPTPDQPA